MFSFRFYYFGIHLLFRRHLSIVVSAAKSVFFNRNKNYLLVHEKDCLNQKIDESGDTNTLTK